MEINESRQDSDKYTGGFESVLSRQESAKMSNKLTTNTFTNQPENM